MDVIVVVVMVVKVVVVIVVVMIAELRRDWPPTAAAWFVGGAGAVRSGRLCFVIAGGQWCEGEARVNKTTYLPVSIGCL